MKALVTGATGFVGSHLVASLLEKSFEVRIMARKSSSFRFIDRDRVEIIEASLSDVASLSKAVAGVDVIFHLAGCVNSTKRNDFFEINTQGTKRLFEAAKKNTRLKHFLFVSSLAAAGPAQADQPKNEDSSDHPVSAYGQSKKEAEEILKKERVSFPISIVRPPVVYGPRDQGMLEIFQMARSWVTPILKAENPKASKTYSVIFVRDLCEGILRIHEKAVGSNQKFELFYLAEPEVQTYEGFMEVIWKHNPKRGLRIAIRPSFLKALRSLLALMGGQLPGLGRSGLNVQKIDELLPDFWVCSSQKAQNELGFLPKQSFEKNLLETMAWYQKQKWL